MIRTWSIAIAITSLLSMPALAQEQTTTLSATVGIENWVAGNEPMTVHATIESDLLVTGSLHVTYGGAATHIPVDVPAGGSKTYDIPLRSPFGNASIRVDLLDVDGERIATQSIRPEIADDELVVGVVGNAAIVSALSSIEIAFDGIPVEPVDTPPDVSAAEAGGLGYLVTDAPTPEMWDFVASGGRLVTPSSEIAAAQIELRPLGTVPGTDIDWYATPAGGEVLALDTIDDPGEWRLALRPVPLRLVPSDRWGTPESSLLQSATTSGDGALATIPWLPFGMVAYLVIIGPVNMFVLKRMGRREWAWLTVPVLAFLTVGVFWVAGRQRLDTVTARHATVSVSAEQSYARSLTVLAAGNAGDYSVALPGAEAYAISDVNSAWGGAMGSSAPGSIDANGVSWELPQLGVGAVETWGTAEGRLGARYDQGTGSVEVTNETTATVDHWGAVANGNVYVAESSLPPGQTQRLTLDDRFVGWQGATMGDAVVEMKQLWNENGYEVIVPLGYAAAGEMGSRTYAFGISESTSRQATVNGATTDLDGPTIWLTPFRWDDGLERASGTVVGVGDFRTLEAGQGAPWIDSDRILLSFSVAGDAGELQVQRSEQGWSIGSIEAWDWTAQAFVEIGVDQPLDPATFASPSGEVLVRMGADGATSEPPYPQSIVVVWGPGR